MFFYSQKCLTLLFTNFLFTKFVNNQSNNTFRFLWLSWDPAKRRNMVNIFMNGKFFYHYGDHFRLMKTEYIAEYRQSLLGLFEIHKSAFPENFFPDRHFVAIQTVTKIEIDLQSLKKKIKVSFGNFPNNFISFSFFFNFILTMITKPLSVPFQDSRG